MVLIVRLILLPRLLARDTLPVTPLRNSPALLELCGIENPYFGLYRFLQTGGNAFPCDTVHASLRDHLLSFLIKPKTISASKPRT